MSSARQRLMSRISNLRRFLWLEMMDDGLPFHICCASSIRIRRLEKAPNNLAFKGMARCFLSALDRTDH